MCIVTWVYGQDYFALTHTRDENIHRPFSLEIHEEHGVQFLKDIPSQGTWMMDSPRFIACLLNGAQKEIGKIYENGKSRGQILFLLNECLEINDFKSLNLQGFSAFTILVFEKNRQELFELSFNGENLEITNINPFESHLYCSSTLYSTEEKEELKKEFIENNFRESKEVLNFHKRHQMKLGKVHLPIKSVCLSQTICHLPEKSAKMLIFGL